MAKMASSLEADIVTPREKSNRNKAAASAANRILLSKRDDLGKSPAISDTSSALTRRERQFRPQAA